ncbi:MAG TPA: DbpA RNA binding domain-containing protein, partial [Caulobacteraceae bacterium]
PVNKAGLLHRSGRTGRAGKKGVSVLMVSHTRRRKVELMLQQASIAAEWSGPPSADEIRAKDRERMLTDPVLTAPADEESLELGRALLERSSPEQVAAALIRLYQQKMPPPEDIQDDERMARAQASGRNQQGQADGPLVDFARGGDMAWFRINIGRDKNADPKWVLPLICRLGHVTKRDVGSIKIFERETKFEITRETEARFRAAIAQPNDQGATIQDAVAPAAGEKSLRKWDKPQGKAQDRSQGDRPARPAYKRPDNASSDRPARPEKPAFKPPFKPRADAGKPTPGGKPKWGKRKPS